MTELEQIKDAIISGVIRAVRKELRLTSIALLTIPEVARKYRKDKEEIRLAAKEGLVKSAKRKPRNGDESFMIDANDAERVWGAK